MSKLNCPLCGFKQLKEKVIPDAKGQVTLGPAFTFKEVYLECPSCAWAGDLSGETDKNYLKAKKKAEAQLVKDIIKELNGKGITMSFFERVFELPVRTLTRWKNSTSSAAGLALLRIIKTYPWITEVAAHKYEQAVAEETIIQAGNSFFLKETGVYIVMEPNSTTYNDFEQSFQIEYSIN